RIGKIVARAKKRHRRQRDRVLARRKNRLLLTAARGRWLGRRAARVGGRSRRGSIWRLGNSASGLREHLGGADANQKNRADDSSKAHTLFTFQLKTPSGPPPETGHDHSAPLPGVICRRPTAQLFHYRE